MMLIRTRSERWLALAFIIATACTHNRQASSLDFSSMLSKKNINVESDAPDTKKEPSDSTTDGTPELSYPGQPVNSFGQPTYGVDISFPIHREKVSTNYAWLPHNVDPENNPTPKEYEGMPIQPLGNKQAEYDKLIQGCVKHYGKRGHSCIVTDQDRVSMSLRQPSAMQNYTELGFKKIRAPDHVMELVKKFWETNHGSQSPENWPTGNTYTNHWEAETNMVSVENPKLRGGGTKIKSAIWSAARETIEEWTGEELTQCSLYGIRVYKEGAVLATHVDRMPLVSSAIVNVAQDVDEPWPLEVYAHDGMAYNVTMEPGDMVLYESHSVLHGRPFPLKGRYYANIFIHFEPTGHTLRHGHAEGGSSDVEDKYRQAVGEGRGGHEQEASDGLPPYIVRGSVEETRWKQTHRNEGNKKEHIKSFATGSTQTVAHLAAQGGDLRQLERVVEKKKELVTAKDENGWTPLHEGARAGSIEVVDYLLKKGADANERTNYGTGASALWLAENEHGGDHPIVSFLKGIGALSLGPEL
mmetsp:Transcript_15567/g.21269  ORF Transcript_15567/g.21269 Transcript_15567/m.21269 type:complete len:527 (-) Transcript_15567:272-1852(-)